MPQQLSQFATFGALFVGLDATPTGTDASADVCADFTGCTATLLTAPSVAVPVLAAHSQTLGSTFKIQESGVWSVEATIVCQTAASVRAALGIDNVAGELNTDPAVPNGTRMLDLALRIAAGADTDTIKLTSGDIVVTDALAKASGSALVRLLLSNNAGGGAAAAALSLANCYIRFTRKGPVPGLMNG